MTTGTTVYDNRVQTTVIRPDGAVITVPIGPYFYKFWAGGDSKVQKKTVSLPSYSGFPPRPDLENRLPNESSREFRRRRRMLLKEWRAAVAVWHRDRPKKRPKVPRTRVVMPPNSYSVEIRKKVWAPFHIRDTNGLWYTQQVAVLEEGAHIPLDPQDHYAVIEKLRRKVYGSGFHPGITGAEGRKTLEMFATNAKQIRLAMVSLYNGSWRGIIRQLGSPTPQWAGRARDGFLGWTEGRKTFSQAWLCFAYGWRPLLKDMEEGLEWMAEVLNGNQALLTRHSARKSFVKQNFWKPSEYISNRVAFTHRVSIHRVQYVITNLKASPAVSAPSWASLAGVAWEVLPYSFICDWVAPIGGYLQALRTSKDLQGTVVCSVLSESYWDFPQVHPQMKAAIPVSPTLTSSYRMVTFRRTVSQELNPPTPLGDLSPSSVFSHWSRAVSAVALLQNLRFPEKDRFGLNKILGRKS